jgi:hypothetical protein
MEVTARFGAVPRGALILVILGVALTLATTIAVGSQPSTSPRLAGPGAFGPGPSLGAARANHTSTLLPDGRILVAGGFGPNASAEVRDPETGSFEPTGSLAVGRFLHRDTLLPDGSVLITGGHTDATRLAERWDPSTGSFTPAGTLAEPESRGWHTATLLQDGRVLLVGGPALASAELWDPVTSTFSWTGPLTHRRGWHTATLLEDGRVLIAGGPAQAELWDPATEEFSDAGSLPEARFMASATLLGDGRVLIVGGGAAAECCNGGPVPTAQVWDPTTLAFSPAGSLSQTRANHTATLLPDGRVLIIGGTAEEPLASAELWDPVTRSFSPAASLAEGRLGHTATLLPDGRVVVIGGQVDNDVPLSSTEVWDPLTRTSATEARDWPGPLRQEPSGGAPVIPGEWRADEGAEDTTPAGGQGDWHFPDAQGDEGVVSYPWLDIINVVFDRRSAVIDLLALPASSDPSERWLAYGIVADIDGDGRGDLRLGIDNAPGSEHRAWRTDLATGKTAAQTGPPYGMNHLPDTWFPGESGPGSSSATFRGAFGYTLEDFVGRPRIYAWAAEIQGGRVVATDYAPDSGWLDARPDER